MIGPCAKPLHHAAAHHTPAQRAHDLPESHALRLDLAARFLVSSEQFFARTKAADRLVDLAKAPGGDADPSQILHRIAAMRELPIQDRADAVGPDHEVAVAEVAMHQ